MFSACLTSAYSLLSMCRFTVQMNSSEVNSGGQWGNSTSRLLWYQHPQCAATSYAFIFYYGGKVLNLVVGTPCNVLVVWHIASRKSDASTSDIFFLNLAVLDAYFCLMTPIDLVNQMLLSNGRIWYFQHFAYGVKDSAPLFLVSLALMNKRSICLYDLC